MPVTPHALPMIFASAISVDFDLTFLAQFALFTTFVSVPELSRMP